MLSARVFWSRADEWHRVSPALNVSSDKLISVNINLQLLVAQSFVIMMKHKEKAFQL